MVEKMKLDKLDREKYFKCRKCGDVKSLMYKTKGQGNLCKSCERKKDRKLILCPHCNKKLWVEESYKKYHYFEQDLNSVYGQWFEASTDEDETEYICGECRKDVSDFINEQDIDLYG